MQKTVVDAMVMNVINSPKKILIIGKIPPIQGGVSEHTYQLARDLASRGFVVHVITNADEVEHGFRCIFDSNDEKYLNEVNNLTIHQTQKGGASFIPRTTPYFSKILGLAVGVMKNENCDLIYASYFEPYGLVASTISRLFNRPLLIKHAGSDLFRLAKHPDLAAAYSTIMHNAEMIISSGNNECLDSLVRLGADPDKIKKLSGSRLPKAFWNPNKNIGLERFGDLFGNWYAGWDGEKGTIDSIKSINAKTFDSNRITIGIYGKIAEEKGSFDLLQALSDLADNGYEFNFITAAGGTNINLSAYYSAIISHKNLSDKTWIFPFMAPWRVPDFLNLSNITCFLERNFPISAHGSRIPREILSSGSCLVCSGEIFQKLSYRDNLINGKNFVLINEPQNIDELREALKNLISNKEKPRIIGINGKYLARNIDDFTSFVNPIESLISQQLNMTC